ncbi:unnamed protein product [Microthlaspi erraticum]|uniref:Peptidase A1 domain-containing protein n=1 Tax=Microthlaspi erraticum TaxID=1685480 RepID=A0A6D2HEV6_9BRAS|nr:unnamed protein product [Microthlaspi erraticum]
MAMYVTSLFFLILCFIASFHLLSASPQTRPPTSLHINLVHTGFMHAQDQNYISHIQTASTERLNYLRAKATGNFIAHITPLQSPPAFLANVSIGVPPVTQMLHMDTASSLLWLQCRPCSSCYPQNFPIYDPSSSFTYQHEPCETSLSSFPYLTFDPETGVCSYSITYMDGSRSSGTLASETLTFNTIYEWSIATLPYVVFGCGNDNDVGPYQSSLSGVLGLGYGNLSLVRRFGSKFSYCFDRLSNPSYPYNVLVIGDDGAEIMGDKTPLEIHNGLYYLTLEGISVDGKSLPIDPHVFQRDYKTGDGGTIIDTGCSITSLVRVAYDALMNEIGVFLDRRFKPVVNNKNPMKCYVGDFDRDLVRLGFPVVNFHFSGGAELSLDVKSLFMKAQTGAASFCLTIMPSVDEDLSVIGAMSQQGYNVGYDLEAKVVSFDRIDCGILFDN